MPKYLAQSTYTKEGLAGLLKEGGSARLKAIEQLINSAGGKIESFYYAFGDTDLFMVCDAPDNVTAAAVSLLVNSTGVSQTKVTVLLTPQEVDAATKKSMTYRPPGK